MMTTDLRRLLAVLTLLASLVLGACGGDGGERVTGDSPDGVPVDSALEDEVVDGEQEVPDGDSGEEFDADESLTDGQ